MGIRVYEGETVMCERVNVLCGCGWGLLSVPLDDVPEECPICDRWLGENFEITDDEEG